MNKNKLCRWMIIGALACAGNLCSSCENVDEVPPRSNTSTSRKTYKMPDPATLSADEAAEVDRIKNEYKENTTQTTTVIN